MLHGTQNILIMRKKMKIKKSNPVKVTIWMRALYHLESAPNASQLAMMVNCTYSHMIDILEIFGERGWVTVKKVGRENKYKFTEKGKLMRNCVIPILVEMKETWKR